jgi:DNA-binding XRE family transcriptional regulator
MQDVGQRIRDKRKSLGLTQDQLCQQVGISKSFLSEVETGKRNLSSAHLLGIAKALGCSCDFLLVGGDLPAGAKIPPSLGHFAANKGLSYKQVEALLGVHRQAMAFHGKKERSEVNWDRLYKWLKGYLEP